MGRSRRRAPVGPLLASATLILVSCSAPAPSSDRASEVPSTSAPTHIRPTAAACPNTDGGGACVGALTAGRSYATQRFIPQLTYQVPASGWSNFEDAGGNFLLVPPGNDLPGVNAGTSDFIGVYTSITPERITRADGCVTEPVPGAGDSPAAMAAWFRRQPELVTSTPRSIELGGFKGVRVDLRVRSGAKLATCTVDGQRIELAGLFGGVRPSFLDHAVIPGMAMRLYLLDFEPHTVGPSSGHVLGVELDDIASAPGDLDQLSAVAEGLTFSP